MKHDGLPRSNMYRAYLPYRKMCRTVLAEHLMFPHYVKWGFIVSNLR